MHIVFCVLNLDCYNSTTVRATAKLFISVDSLRKTKDMTPLRIFSKNVFVKTSPHKKRAKKHKKLHNCTKRADIDELFVLYESANDCL